MMAQSFKHNPKAVILHAFGVQVCPNLTDVVSVTKGGPVLKGSGKRLPCLIALLEIDCLYFLAGWSCQEEDLT